MIPWSLEEERLIAEKIERALDQFERGEFLTEDESRADLERRKAAWLGDQTRR